ncbi:MAG: 2-hydroxychromene-2-carboxylate isomerase [Hyphomicrobiales bacterium]|nr:2-hydroxychromene-2-carboxylate isomerase [Hyphomicrobiales bacterium]MCC2107504.1 2-hydroxychromene-2-carboxylate isomerase [Hyphomicrobiales bacterium]
MTVSLSFWFDFASTYSYPAAMRIEQWARERDVAVVWRPFLLGPIFADQGWRTSPFNVYPAKGRYMWRDLERICEGQGLPFARPDPFPQHSLLAARVATALDGDARSKFCYAVFAAEFGRGQSIDSEEFVSGILREMGAPAETLARAGSPEVKAALRDSVTEAGALSIFGAPSFTTADGELFWGFDRLATALDWARARA